MNQSVYMSSMVKIAAPKTYRSSNDFYCDELGFNHDLVSSKSYLTEYDEKNNDLIRVSGEMAEQRFRDGAFENNFSRGDELSWYRDYCIGNIDFANYSSSLKDSRVIRWAFDLKSGEKFREKCYSECLSVLQKNDPISGETSLAKQYMYDHVEQYSAELIKDALLRIYDDNCDNVNIVSGILQMFSCLSYEVIMSDSKSKEILTGLLSHQNIDLQDDAIQLFEQWNSKKSLPLLKKTKCKKKWLQRYLEEVIDYIEREGNN